MVLKPYQQALWGALKGRVDRAVLIQTPRRAGKSFVSQWQDQYNQKMVAMVSDPLIFTGFGDGDDHGWGAGDGRGLGHVVPEDEFEGSPFHDPGPDAPYHRLLDGNGHGYGPHGLRCPGHQFVTTRSFNGHLTNIFLRGLSS